MSGVGGKLTAFEGGLRVNAFASGGALSTSLRGSTSSALMHTCDFYATIAEAAGINATDTVAARVGLPPIDSISMW